MIIRRGPSSSRSKERRMDKGTGEKGNERAFPKIRTFQMVLSSLARRTSSRDAGGGVVLGDTSWNTSDETVLATNRSSLQRSKRNGNGRKWRHIREGRLVTVASHAKTGKTSKSDACIFTFSNEDIMSQLSRARARKEKSKNKQILSESQNYQVKRDLDQDQALLGKVELTAAEYPKAWKKQESHPVNNNKDENDENTCIASVKKVLAESEGQSMNVVEQSDYLPVPASTATKTFMKFMTCCSGMEDFPEASDQSMTMV